MLQAPGGLTNEEQAFYRENGFIVPRYRLAADELARLQTQMRAVVAANPQLENRPIPNPHCASFARHGVKTDGGLMEFAVKPDILDILEQISGPDLILWSGTIFHKPAGHGKRTPWHRDGEFWPLNPLATTSVWVAGTESTVDNGCLRLIPGSHKVNDVGRHHDADLADVIFEREIDADLFDPSAAVDIELEPGQMVFFDVRMLRGGEPNRSARPRTAWSARYMPATCRFEHDNARSKAGGDQAYSLSTRPLFLVRGEDRAGNDFTRNRDDVDDALFQRALAA
jgi:hypothetical protein